jgi:hypothetical protein
MSRARRCWRFTKGSDRRSRPFNQSRSKAAIVEPPLAPEQQAEVLPALVLERDDLTIQDRVSDAELGVDGLGKLAEAREDVALEPKVATPGAR